MSEKHVIPVAPGIFIDGNPVVAIVYDINDSAKATGDAPLVINSNGFVEAYTPGGEKRRTYTGPWSGAPQKSPYE